jgi:hypothetical protein
MSRADQYQATQQPEMSEENKYPYQSTTIGTNSKPQSSLDHHSSTTWYAGHICNCLAQCCCCLCLLITCESCCDYDDCELCDC